MYTAVAAPAVSTNSMTGPTGIVARPNADATLAQVSSGPTSLAGQGFKASSVPSPSTSSPTVMSDANIRENVIPEIINTASKYNQPNVPNTVNKTGNNTGNSTNTDNSSTSNTTSDTSNNYGGSTSYEDVFNRVFGEQQSLPQDPTVTRNIQSLDNLRSANDASFNTQISNIISQYGQLMQLQSNADTSVQAKENNFLLKNGAYRTTTGADVFHAIVTSQIDSLSNLQAKENEAIAKVQNAMNQSDYKMAQEEQNILYKVNSDKKALAEKITSSIIAQNQKLNTAAIQSKKDNAIANLFTSGTTDPKDILSKVDPTLNISLKDINTALNTISGGDIKGLSGNVKNFYALKQAGALPGDIAKLPLDEQLQAYLNMEKKTTTATSKATKPLYTTKEGKAITESDIAGGVTRLDQSKDASGFADSKLYKAMYDQWEEAGLDPQEFTKNFPPKYYINPSDTTLPTYLRPSTVKGSGISNPFSSSASSPSGSP